MNIFMAAKKGRSPVSQAAMLQEDRKQYELKLHCNIMFLWLHPTLTVSAVQGNCDPSVGGILKENDSSQESETICVGGV